MTYARLLVLLAAALTGLLACASAPDTDAPADAGNKQLAFEVTSAQFGVFGTDSDGHRSLFETDRFQAQVAAPYGWYLLFRSSKPTVIWREEFELPEPPPSWGPGEALGLYTISPDRRTAVTERVIPTQLGFIANEWRYAQGDPIGSHVMRIYIDGQLVREFKFIIEDGPGNDRPAERTGPTT
jgi:hypothetical protein